MAKKKNKYDTTHLKNVSSYERQIAEIYKEAVREAALLGTSVPNVDADKVFSFADYPITTRRINTLLDTLQRNVSSVIINGINAEWALSNEKNDELVNSALGQAVRGLTAEQRRQYFSNNDSALQAFSERKVNGMNLSDRVWKYTDQFKSEIELGIDIGLREGRSAQQLSQDLRSYLQHPDKLFRRVRDEHGNLVLSRRAAAYHPGQGVYRSSYRNAIRMTGTETNMAYRTADHNRWQQLDFVVGQEIHTSNNHTLNGKPLEDMCDELAGRYPKDFEFMGWHPNCRCYATSILKSREEMREDSRRIMNGEEPLPAQDSMNYVPTVPKNFEDWVIANEERIARAKSMPYFLSNNASVVNGILGKEVVPIVATSEPIVTTSVTAIEGAVPSSRSVWDIAEERHAQRTPERELEIRRYWQDKVMKFTPEQLKNFEDIEKALGVKRGLMMTFEEANTLRANPNYGGSSEFFPDPKGLYRNQQGERFSKNLDYKKEYAINCASCVAANELRRLGFDVEAIGRVTGNMADRLAYHSEFAWLDSKGFIPTSTKVQGISRSMEDTIREMQNQMQDVGRYHVKWQWNEKGGHIITCEKLADGSFRYYCPQTGEIIDDFVKYAIDKGVDITGLRGDGLEFLRVDNLLPDPAIIKEILRKYKVVRKK